MLCLENGPNTIKTNIRTPMLNESVNPEPEPEPEPEPKPIRLDHENYYLVLQVTDDLDLYYLILDESIDRNGTILKLLSIEY